MSEKGFHEILSGHAYLYTVGQWEPLVESHPYWEASGKHCDTEQRKIRGNKYSNWSVPRRTQQMFVYFARFRRPPKDLSLGFRRPFKVSQSGGDLTCVRSTPPDPSSHHIRIWIVPHRIRLFLTWPPGWYDYMYACLYVCLHVWLCTYVYDYVCALVNSCQMSNNPYGKHKDTQARDLPFHPWY